MLRLMVLGMFVLSPVLVTGRGADGLPETASSWIWYPEDVCTEGVGQTRYLRKTFDLRGKVAEARFRVRADDSMTCRVNGRSVSPARRQGAAGDEYDVASLLRPGRNVLSFAVTNAAGKGGLILRGAIRERDGRTIPLVSDESFRASRQAPKGWDLPDFDDSAWPRATIVGGAFCAPWFTHPAFDMAPFIRAEEWAQWKALRARLLTLPEGLADEAPARAEFAFVRGSCVLRINGQARPPFLYRGTVDPLSQHGRRQLGLFRDAGVHVYTAYYPLAACWTGPGNYRFDILDDRVRGYLSVDPKSHILLILRLVPPTWWMDAHPEELVQYAAGADYNTTDECGRVRRASFASSVWRRDALAIWRAAIAHLEAQPWGKRVIGYQPGYGIYTEWHYFGSWTNQMPDTGPAMTNAFRAWLRRRYGTLEHLRRAWGMPDATFAGATVPGVAPRLAAGPLGLRRPVRGRRVMDYYRCQQEITVEDIEAFCAAAKDLTGGRVVTGAFYGYYYGVAPQTQGGHLELERLLRSPAIDYFAAPYDYSHRLMGDDGRARSIIDAFAAAGKVHMIEADTRTFLHPRREYGRLSNRTRSMAAIRREVATALTHGTALWWCDFGRDGSGGWYDDPALIGTVKNMVRLAETCRQRPRERQAQVALVCDPRSCYWLGDGEAMKTHVELVDRVTSELYRTGTPFDTILLSQFLAAPQKRYRVVIFLDTLCLDAARRRALAKSCEGRSVLWLWAPGITDGTRFGPELVRECTGFPVRLAGNGIQVGRVECPGQDALTARIPQQDSVALTVTSAAGIPAFLRADAWYNPRTEEVMRRDYTAYAWTVNDDQLLWTLATSRSWSDIHLRAPMAECEGLRLEVSGRGACTGVSLRLAVKGADGGEFVAPAFSVSAVRERHVLPFADFTKAPWYRGKASRIRFPLTGLKIILNRIATRDSGTLCLYRLETVRGKTIRTRRRIYGDAGRTTPVLTIEPAPGVDILGRDPISGRAVLAARGNAPQRQVFSTLPFVPRQLLAALFDEAGVCRMIRTAPVVVRADSELVCLHTATACRPTLHLPRSETLHDALSGEKLGQGRSFDLSLPADSTTLLLRDP